MLDPKQPVAIPGADLLGYADLDSVAELWVLPRAPRLARGTGGSAGSAQASLLLYRRGAGDVPPEGGQLSLVVDFALTAAETAAAEQVIRARQAAARPPAETAGPPADVPTPLVRTPNWLQTSVTVTVLPGFTLAGNGSLAGTNQATLTAQLTGPGTGLVDEAWAAGFPDAEVAADVTVEAQLQAEAAGHRAEAAATGSATGSSTQHHELSAAVRIRRAEPLTLRLTGPLRLPPEIRSTQRTVITL